jgi:hypothetical protein
MVVRPAATTIPISKTMTGARMTSSRAAFPRSPRRVRRVNQGRPPGQVRRVNQGCPPREVRRPNHGRARARRHDRLVTQGRGVRPRLRVMAS